ncbi:BspA family leucine-rich repeat surface protein [Bacteroides sp. Ga6A2]|uniref:BspA family leucine-rich repeat surface protein n=1 Tax=Bacteroides sp. Ga6A2 TaxID=1410608 RepID=UPI0009DE2A99|nr:BspA family leucine-rich repeat surface protein [Bacteroides sp. Ga6A2]
MKHIFTILLSIILLGTNPACTLEQEAYAVMSPDSTTLTFYYDNQKASRQGTVYEIEKDIATTLVVHTQQKETTYEMKKKYINPKWVKLTEDSLPDNENFTTVVFDNSFKNARPESCRYWFAGFRSLTKIEGISNLNTSNVTNMYGMFYNCKSLTKLDVRNFDTSKVTNMGGMFFDCICLTELDVSNFNTSKVTDMHGMFFDCICLTELDVSNFNTSNVTDMLGMFSNCENLTSIDVSRFDTSNVTDMSWMFDDCKSLTSIDVSNFNTSKVTYMHGMFRDCEILKTIYVGKGWNTSKIEDSENMFENCINLVGGKGTKFNPEVADITRAKIDGGKANPGYFTAKK